jgi:hypothetical protein
MAEYLSSELQGGAGQDDRDWVAELERLEGASRGSLSEAADWCKRAIDYLRRDVARKGNDWNGESGSALRLTLAAFGQAVAQGADSAVLTRLQVPPVRTIPGRPLYAPMAARTGLIKLQEFGEWCANRAGQAKGKGAGTKNGKLKANKRRLEESEKKSDQLKLQVYNYIVTEHAAGKTPAGILAEMKASKDRRDQVTAAGLKLDKKLIRAAIARPRQRVRDEKQRNEKRKKQDSTST